MAAHHVDLPEQVVTPGEELWVKIIDIDLQRRRISLSIKQAAEGGEVAAEYREHFGEQNYDEQGNYIGAFATTEFEPETEAQAAWADYVPPGVEVDGEEQGPLTETLGEETGMAPPAGAAGGETEVEQPTSPPPPPPTPAPPAPPAPPTEEPPAGA